MFCRSFFRFAFAREHYRVIYFASCQKNTSFYVGLFVSKTGHPGSSHEKIRDHSEYSGAVSQIHSRSQNWLNVREDESESERVSMKGTGKKMVSRLDPCSRKIIFLEASTGGREKPMIIPDMPLSYYPFSGHHLLMSKLSHMFSSHLRAQRAL